MENYSWYPILYDSELENWRLGMVKKTLLTLNGNIYDNGKMRLSGYDPTLQALTDIVNCEMTL